MKKNKKYIDSLYSKIEQNQIKKSVLRKRFDLENSINDYLLLDEQIRILKKHFKLTTKEFTKIIEKYRMPSKLEKELLNKI